MSSKKTHILAKEAALEDSITVFQQKIKDADFNIVEQSCLNPIANIWSVTIHDNECKLLSSSGKGFSKKAAIASALGEFVERLSTHHFWTDCYFGGDLSNNKFLHFPKEKWFETNSDDLWPDGVLEEKNSNRLGQALRAFYNPNDELNPSTLIDTNSGDHNKGICCLPYDCIRTKKIVNFPINIIDNLYSCHGMSAGNTVEEARVHALSEILATYIKFKVIAEGVSLPDVPDEIIARYPNIQTSIKEMEKTGYPLLVQDASLGGKYPVLAISLLNPNNQGVCTSFSAHPKFEVALENALTGLLQKLKLDEFNDYTEAGFDMDEVASSQNLENHFLCSKGIVSWRFLSDSSDCEFVDWDERTSTCNSIDEFKKLCDLIHAQGNDIFISDFNEIGIYACQIIVPGMSEVYPVDKLILENNNAGMTIRHLVLKHDKTIEEIERLIEELEDLNLDDQTLVSTLIKMPSDKDNIFEDLCVTELITLLALKVQDNERIQEGCEWLIHYQKINPRRLKTYQCINTLLQLEGMTNYGTALVKLYTRSIFNDALALIDGKDVFPLVSEWKTHSSLNNAYKKLLKI